MLLHILLTALILAVVTKVKLPVQSLFYSPTPRLGTSLGQFRLDYSARQSHAWVAMEVETKFLRLFKPGGWRVCWIGGWDKCRILFVVMVERPRRALHN